MYPLITRPNSISLTFIAMLGDLKTQGCSTVIGGAELGIGVLTHTQRDVKLHLCTEHCDYPVIFNVPLTYGPLSPLAEYISVSERNAFP